MFSTHIKQKFVIVERFIRTLKNKIYKCMTSIPENVYIDKSDDIVNKCNNIYHSIIKSKPADVKSWTYIDFNQENKKEDPKLKAGEQVKQYIKRI